MRGAYLAAVCLLATATGSYADVIAELSISQLHERMQRQELTAEQLVTSYLKSIDKIDRAGPMLNSIIELNP